MSWRSGLVAWGLVFHAMFTGVCWASTSEILFAFGPGGPHRALTECAELFHQESGIRVEVLKSRPQQLAGKLKEFGDLYYGGAEYMLEEFTRSNPGVLDLSSAVSLHPRRIGIIVRKGNPLDIEGLHQLASEEVDLLAARREKMEPFHPPGKDGESTVRWYVDSGWEGVGAWRAQKELDAWVTYKSWHRVLEEETEFLPISGDHAVRHTPVALTRHTPHRNAAEQFISFLQSAAARRIFEDHGWY